MAFRRTLLITATAVAGVVLGGPAASATVVDRGHYGGPYSYSYDDCGFPIDVVGSDSGHFRVRAGKGKQATAFFVNDNYSFRETQTNAETGEFVTVVANAIFNEVKAKPLGGNLFEFTAVEAGQPVAIYDSSGRLVARDRGSIHHRAIFDTLGDDVIGAVLVEDLEPQVHGPHPVFESGFCAIIEPLIGS